MKLRHSILSILGCFLCLASIQGCALFGGGDQQEDVDSLEEEMQEEDDQQEGDEESNEEENQEANASNFNIGDGMANLANNDASMLGAEGMGVPENTQDGLDGMAMPDQSNMAGMEDLNSLMNGADSNAMADGMMAPAPMDSAMPSAAGTTMAAPEAAGGAKVYYVIAGGAELKDSPGGSTVSTLPQGEPCLATIEGEWANLANRGYIQISQLSTTPIGRAQDVIAWQ